MTRALSGAPPEQIPGRVYLREATIPLTAVRYDARSTGPNLEQSLSTSAPIPVGTSVLTGTASLFLV